MVPNLMQICLECMSIDMFPVCFPVCKSFVVTLSKAFSKNEKDKKRKKESLLHACMHPSDMVMNM